MPIISRNIWYCLEETDHSPVREIALTRRINGSCLDEKLRLSGGNLALTCRRYNTYLEETWRSAAAHRKAQPKEDIPQMVTKET